MNRRVLIVEDDLVSAEFMRLYLESEGWVVSAVTSVAQALEALPSFNPTIVITDMRLGDGNGSELAAKFKASANGKVIGVTGFSRAQLIEMKVDLQHFDTILEKPVEFTELTQTLNSC